MVNYYEVMNQMVIAENFKIDYDEQEPWTINSLAADIEDAVICLMSDGCLDNRQSVWHYVSLARRFTDSAGEALEVVEMACRAEYGCDIEVIPTNRLALDIAAA